VEESEGYVSKRIEMKRRAEAHLNSSDPELDQSPQHLSPRDLVGRSTAGNLDEQTIVVRLPDIQPTN